MKNNLCFIGKIVKPFGIKGEITVKLIPDPRMNEYIDKIKHIYLYICDDITKYDIKTIRKQNLNFIISLEEITSRNQAETLRNSDIYIDKSQIPKENNNSYYWFEIIGTYAFDTKKNLLGKVIDIYNNGVYDIFIIKRDNCDIEYFIPALPQFLVEFNRENNYIIFHLIEGLLEINDAV